MNSIIRSIIILLIFSITACISPQSNVTVKNDEDKDIGLGGTGLLANTGGGLGGTGIVGEITGYGSIFVNGIEIEYDDNTAFTIDGETSEHQQLMIGDIVEVLTIDDKTHTQAQAINLRHEIIGRVESVNNYNLTFTVHGQSIIQSINNGPLPKIGETVAVFGFRIDDKTILSTRVALTADKRTLLRTNTELPFKEHTNRWLVQTYAKNGKASFQFDGVTHAVDLKLNTSQPLNNRPVMKILQLHLSASDRLKLDGEIETVGMPRGQHTPLNPTHQWPGGNMMQGPGSGSGSGSGPGSGSGSSPGPGSGSGPMNNRSGMHQMNR